MNVYKKSDITSKLYLLDPIDLVPYFEEIAGQWNGDDSGKGEDRAHIANDIIALLTELQNT
jgi:hypothetical protein